MTASAFLGKVERSQLVQEVSYTSRRILTVVPKDFLKADPISGSLAIAISKSGVDETLILASPSLKPSFPCCRMSFLVVRGDTADCKFIDDSSSI